MERNYDSRSRLRTTWGSPEWVYLPPYSPDFNPIENAFSELKALLRKAAERTVDALWDRIGAFASRVPPARVRQT
jgi:transposase